MTYEPRSTALDSQGSLAIAGAASRGGAPTAKFSPELQPVWERRYERPGEEQADAVIVGVDDQICAGGITETVPTDGARSHHAESYATDVWIRCYTATGKQLWEGRYSEQCSRRAEQDHTLTSMALAPDGGIVFTGSNCRSPTWIQKVGDSGDVGWSVEIEDLRDPWIAVGQEGQVHVAGKLSQDLIGANTWIWRATLVPG